MDRQRKIILYAWLSAAGLGLALIFFARSKSGGDQDLAKSILGIWQGVGFDEVDQFKDNGTVMIQGPARSGVVKYKVLDSGRLQFLPENDMTEHIFKDVSIKGDELTMTNALLKGVVRYKRLVPGADTKLPPVAKLESPQPLPSNQPKQIIRPSPPPVPADQQQAVQMSNELKKAIIGKWQTPDKTELYEWTDEDTMVIGDAGQPKITCSYKVVGYNRLMVVFQGMTPMDAPMFTVSINGDVMTETEPGKDGPMTSYFVRLNARGEMPTVSLPADVEDLPPIKASDVVGTWSARGENLAFAQDGTFILGETKGRWEVKRNVVIARGTDPGTIWKMTLSPDRKTLWGYWSDHMGEVERTGIIIATR